MLEVKPLDWFDCAALSPVLREADLMDLKVKEMDPLEVLEAGLDGGPAWAVYRSGFILGAGGFTWEGAVWSMWRDLRPLEAREVMRMTPKWARWVREVAGPDKWLWNVYLQGNRQTEAFLRASHCVTIDKEHPIEHDGRVFIPFHLKSAEELSRV